MSDPVVSGESSDSDEFASAESDTEVEATDSNVGALSTAEETDPRGQEVCDGEKKSDFSKLDEEKSSASEPSESGVNPEAGEVDKTEAVGEQHQVEGVEEIETTSATEESKSATDESKSATEESKSATEESKSATEESKSATEESKSADGSSRTETCDTEPSLPEESTPKQRPAVAKSETKETVKSGSGGGGGGGGWGSWGGWGSSLWSSVSSVAESAQVIGQKVTSVITSVEDSLGVPSPEEVAEDEAQQDEETRRLAEAMVEHDVTEKDEVVKEEPRQPEFSPADSEYLESESPAQVGGDGDGAVATMSNFFSGFAAAVQTTGQGLVTGGLDALETLGKKTMEVLSEGDPGLARKRAMLGMGASPSLSQLLMEAKAEGSARAAAEREGGGAESTAVTLNYSRLFEEYHGVGHLEALELLSKECAAKSRAMGSELSEASVQRLQEKLEELSQSFIFEDDQTNLEDDSCQLLEAKELLSSTSLPIKSDKLLNVSSEWRGKIESVLHKIKERHESEAASKDSESSGGDKEDGDKEESSATEDKAGKEGETDKESVCVLLYGNGLRSLAELTSASIELFRKMAEMSLIPQAVSGDPLELAKIFNKLTTMILNELDCLASVHAEAITNLDVDGSNSNVTSLYLESSNSGSYVQDACQLLQPVLKVILTQQLMVQQPSPEVIHRN